MTLAVEFASWVLILLGSFFTIVGAFGIVRMPEIFTRMHAASVTDTLGVGFLILGMGLQAGFDLVTLKLVFLLALFFFTGPVVTHALAQACLHEGIKPLLAEDRRGMARRRPIRTTGGSYNIPHQRGAIDATCCGDDRHRPPTEPVRCRNSHQHLQFPDCERTDCARRGGCRHDRSVGRGRHVDGAVARYFASDQDHRDAAGPPQLSCPCSSR